MTKPRTLIVGLGKTGVSCARYLAAHGHEVAVTDSRDQPPGLAALRREVPDAAVFVGGFSEEALARAEQVVLSPGVPLADPYVQRALARGLPVVGDIELFARAARAPVVAVTGSNGKSTVVTIVGLMAERAGRRVRVGANLGTPALDLLADGEPDLYVLELSSFQLETTHSLAPLAAAVLNVSPDHMDRYATFDDYAAAKARIYRGCRIAVLNRDDACVMAMRPAGATAVTFGLGASPADGDYGLLEHAGGEWLARGREPLMPVTALRVRGRHNVANALAALALGEAAGLAREAMIDVLSEFRGLPHRTEWVAEVRGVTWLNDSKATNVGATLAAVAGFATPLVLIAGGDGKGQDFAPLAAALPGRVRAVVLLGRDAPRIAAAIGDRVPVKLVTTMEQAVKQAARLAKAGDTVLLSPACSSLDMFENFEQRGRQFAEAVRRLAP